MTQLVELQHAMPLFEEAGIKLYAISYDEVDALADFAEHHNITFELLSDLGSNVIREFGILNHHIPPEQVPYHGIPFPGTYLVDESGVVSAKAFHQSLAQRESPEGLIDAALGKILLRSGEPSVDHHDESGIDFSVTYHGGDGVIRGGALRRLVIRVSLPDGLHLYDDPVPAGMVPVSISLVSPAGLRSMPVEKPATHPLELPGVGELRVWSGQVDFVMPVWATDELASLVRDDHQANTTIELDVAYQACDDQACLLPRTERLALDVPIGPYAAGPALSGDGMPGAHTTSMHSRRWFSAMIKRGMETTPDRAAAERYLLDLMAAHEAGPLGGQDGAGSGGE